MRASLFAETGRVAGVSMTVQVSSVQTGISPRDLLVRQILLEQPFVGVKGR